MRKIKKLKFPLYDKKRQPPIFPKKCTVCGRSGPKYPGLIYLSAGIPIYTDRKSPRNSKHAGFFDLSYETRVYKKLRRGESDIYIRHPIIDDAELGQFDLRFCSFKCLRNFFNQMVSDLEKQAKSKTQKIKKWVKRKKLKKSP